MNFIHSLHPISLFGLGLSVAGFLLFIFAFRGVNISQIMEISGKVSQSIKWRKMVFLGVLALIVVGAAFAALGFALPTWSQKEGGVPERNWYGTWEIKLQGEDVPSDLENIVFDHIIADGGLLQGQMFDAEGGLRGSMTRLKSTTTPADFRLVQGIFKVKEGKSLIVELALHANKETFSGFVYEARKSQRITCWGKKR